MKHIGGWLILVLTVAVVVSVAGVFHALRGPSLCMVAAVAAREYVQAEDAAFDLILACSIGKAPEELCDSRHLRQVVDYAKNLHVAFEDELKGCLSQ